MLRQYVHTVKRDNALNFMHHNCYESSESRGKSVEFLFKRAVAESDVQKDFDIIINTDDVPRGEGSNILHFCTTDENYSQVVPDFFYGGWPEIGAADYNNLINTLYSYDSVPASNKAGWIGTLLCDKRREVYEKCKDLNSYEIRDINWNRQNDGNLHATNYMDYFAQINQWKYLLDIEGGGWSARLKVLLASNRIVFIVDRPYKDWCFTFLKPWHNYVPIKRDLSDLQENYNIIENDMALQKYIKFNQKQLFNKCITQQAAIKKISTILHEL